MHFPDLPVITVMTRARGNTLNADAKNAGGEEEGDHDGEGEGVTAEQVWLADEIVGVTVCIYWRTDTRGNSLSGNHRNIGRSGVSRRGPAQWSPGDITDALL